MLGGSLSDIEFSPCFLMNFITFIQERQLYDIHIEKFVFFDISLAGLTGVLCEKIHSGC